MLLPVTVLRLIDDIGCIGHQETFIVGVFGGESGDDDVAQAGVVQAIDIDAVSETCCIDDGGAGAGADQ